MKKAKDKTTKEKLEKTLDEFISSQKEINSYFECLKNCDQDETECKNDCKKSPKD